MKTVFKNKILSLFVVIFFNTTGTINANNPPKKDFKKNYIQNINLSKSIFITGSPIIRATGNQIYCPQTSIKIVTDISINDPAENTINAINVQISSGYLIGEDVLTLTGLHPTVTSIWNAETGKLSLTSINGNPLPHSDFINAVKNIEFKTSSAVPTGSRNFSINLGKSNYLPSSTHYYQFVSSPGISWGNAKRAAESSSYFGLKGYLATITTLDEAKFIGEQLSGNGWIAGSDALKEGEWRWQSGPEMGTIFWNGLQAGYTTTFAYWNNYKEPDNGGIIDFIKRPGVEDYAYITDPNNGQKGTWNDLELYGVEDPTKFNHPKGYIVEYGGMPGDPPLQMSASTTLTMLAITSTVAPQICNSGSSKLEATTSTGTINWYDTAIGGNIIATGTNFATPILNTSTTYYVESTIAGCKTQRTPVDVKVNSVPNITPETVLSPVCGFGIFFLKVTASEGIINWFPTNSGGSILGTGFTYITPQISTNTTFYAEANNNNCISLTRTPFKIEIYPLPPVTDQKVAICIPGSVELDVSIPNMTYLWNTGETSQTIKAPTTGIYTVDVTSPAPENCTNTKKITVFEYDKPEIKSVKVDETTVTIELIKNEDYFEYSIDGIYYQSSNVFTNAPSGLQTAYVREINQCSIDDKPFIVIIVPKYFTPNNDGYNDVWEIKGLINYPLAEVILFDRYGKKIAQLNHSNRGWDGTFNKNPLPATDYWYVLKLDTNSPELKGHFSLKR
ncbi:T9SS type B sorting domain-containing protein [Flavobacterium sp. M31R6]|uniref:Ig-like domain-containing protein n=1 Tax=Flavobacterium sp. M31R6 TaxID=2739062 RepID=UPI0020C397D6|nr:T9SS type B sorting domain-containing protein [Flavobacterium sp. M31R6]